MPRCCREVTPSARVWLDCEGFTHYSAPHPLDQIDSYETCNCPDPFPARDRTDQPACVCAAAGAGFYASPGWNADTVADARSARPGRRSSRCCDPSPLDQRAVTYAHTCPGHGAITDQHTNTRSSSISYAVAIICAANRCTAYLSEQRAAFAAGINKQSERERSGAWVRGDHSFDSTANT